MSLGIIQYRPCIFLSSDYVVADHISSKGQAVKWVSVRVNAGKLETPTTALGLRRVSSLQSTRPKHFTWFLTPVLSRCDKGKANHIPSPTTNVEASFHSQTVDFQLGTCPCVCVAHLCPLPGTANLCVDDIVQMCSTVTMLYTHCGLWDPLRLSDSVTLVSISGTRAWRPEGSRQPAAAAYGSVI